ncbi:MAG: PAS domain-containing protein [Polyangiaceae bacterium]|nr:PAS domain-containing protein [Polyangiaceae bacterium]
MTEASDVVSFKALFQTSPLALVILSVSGEVIAANAASRALVGERLAQGVRLDELTHPDDALALATALVRLGDGGAPASLTSRLRGDDKPAITWQVWRAPDRSELFAALSKTTVPEASAAEPTKTSEADDDIEKRVLHAMLDHIEILAWAVDKDGIYTFYDGKAAASIGASADMFLGKNVFDIFRDQISPAMRQAFAGSPERESINIMGAHWENWYVPVRDRRGELAGVIGISQNMNESQRIREELEARLALIERQQAVIRDLETPIIQVWDKVLTLPMIGIVDSKRAARLMDDLLQMVVRTSARFAILDLTGVEIVDTATASYLVQMIHAIRLLGAEGILTGIRPSVAQTVISLGVDLKGIPTHGTLRHGLAYCIRQLGGER